MDYWVFPVLSKTISAHQGLSNGSNPLEGEQLWGGAELGYERLDLGDVSTAFMAHPQVVNAIHHSDGGDGYAHDSKGLHFGLRKYLVRDYDGNGNCVGVIAACDHEHLDAEMQLAYSDLKYKIPDVSGLNIGDHLNDTELASIKNAFDLDQIAYGEFEEAFMRAGLMEPAHQDAEIVMPVADV
eukprot:CAMPEP_0196808224 /NCGR_PEP_ID=MMETSP1362-20130617/8219_1 /TAXON_ID=163516 /ORGANISM="Leptocylindrus danicus, Strain CCMP1856" /LENGTH=182 /DNA_ID=CAMNT_0042182481 /DNA_START=155 /DNA_END=703 /DNA_ORIENTATION=+